jgi:hypothetical protein
VENGTHHKPTTTTARKVMSVEPKLHTKETSVGLADLKRSSKPTTKIRHRFGRGEKGGDDAMEKR